MRYLVGLVLALALTGCTTDGGDGGAAGMGGMSGAGGTAGTAGDGGTGGAIDSGLPSKAETEALCAEYCECVGSTKPACVGNCMSFDEMCTAAASIRYVECMIERSCDDPSGVCLQGWDPGQCLENAVEQCHVACPAPPELKFRCQVAGGNCELATACMERCSSDNEVHHCIRYGTCDRAPVPCEGGGCAASVFECSEQGIRDAIEAGGGPHTFDCDRPTKVLTMAEIVINTEVILDGGGNFTVDGGKDHRVFSVSEGAVVELKGFVVTHGAHTSGGCINNDGTLIMSDSAVTACVAPTHGEGGGIRNTGQMMLKNSVVSENTGDDGAGIFNSGALSMTDTLVSRNATGGAAGFGVGGGITSFGALTMTNCEVSDNSGGYYGSGIDSAGMSTLRNSVVRRNDGYHGAGIANYGSLFVTDSTVSDNVSGETAGGISTGETGVVMLVASTVSGNTTGRAGGGIHNRGQLELIDSVVSENTSTGLVSGPSGGGIYNLQSGHVRLTGTTIHRNESMGIGGGITSFGVLTLTNSTLSSNMATEQGGGVSGGTLTMVSTTISGNVAPVGAAISGRSGLGGASSTARNSIIDGECALGQAIESLGGNVESPSDTCFVAQTTDQVSVPASSLQLGALADNGGPTETHALGSGSVAIDAIPAENCVDADGLPLTTDQRGFPRPAGAGCDVGAFELQP